MIKQRLTTAAALLAAAGAAPASAQTPPYVGEVMLMAGGWCPQATLDTDGQLLEIAQYTLLWTQIYTFYGGNGKTTFALPDLRGRAIVGWSNGSDGALYSMGQSGGAETHALTIENMPAHSHTGSLIAADDRPEGTTPADSALSGFPKAVKAYNSGTAPDMAMETGTVSVASTGTGESFYARSPFVGMRYCIAYEGIFP